MTTPVSPWVKSVSWRDCPTLSIPEAGEAVGVSRATAYAAVAAGQWPVIVVGRRKRVLTAGLRRLLGEIDTAGGAA